MWAWRWWTTGAILACAAYPFVPAHTVYSVALFNGVGIISCIALFLGVRRHRPPGEAAWHIFTLGMAILIAGDVVDEISGVVFARHPYPYWDDALYFAAYPLLWTGLLLARRSRGPSGRAGVLDAVMIATSVGLVYWVFLVDPVLGDAGTPTLTRLVTVGYPICDVIMCAVLIRLLTRAGSRGASSLLFAAGALLMLVSDATWPLASSLSAYSGNFANAVFLLGYVCWGAAALHPSMGVRAADVPDSASPFGRGRFVLLTACTLLVPAVLFVQGVRHDAISWVAIGTGAVALFLLVFARMSGFVGQVQMKTTQLEKLAMHDELTRLPNRRRFEMRLSEAVAAGSVQVCLLDLNGFKVVNDRLGHAVGDRLLVAVAERLAAALRDVDLVARMGGDEFAVLVPRTTAAQGDAIVARLATVLREPVAVSGHELLVGASIGIADAAGTSDPGEVLRRADVAMYAAKAGGGRFRRYTTDLDDQAGEEARLGAELRCALDNGQFRLVYQPIVDLPDGRIRYVESLVRWLHPDRGFVSPADFIPVAEQNGLIVELGEWILRTACARFMTWQHAYGPAAPERISVNVSARQLAEPGFARLVAAVLAGAGMPADRLIVEVTETAVFGGGVAVRAVQDLHALGVGIALDDFGTGHSSLGLLQTVPVDVLKVDKSFVDNVTMAGRHAVIATALIHVSNGLGLAAVAEGVETAEQAAELHRLGYRLAQGYHFGKPVAEPEFLGAAELAA